MVTGAVISGSADVGAIVWTPPPGIAKVITSGPGLALAVRIACRNDPAPLFAVFVTTSGGTVPVTVVETDAVLLAKFGSALPPTTNAVLVMTPGTFAVTTIVAVRVPPLGVASRSQTSVLSKKHSPLLAVADTSVTPAGSVSKITMSVKSGPPLVAVSVYVSWSPSWIGSADSVIVNDR